MPKGALTVPRSSAYGEVFTVSGERPEPSPVSRTRITRAGPLMPDTHHAHGPWWPSAERLEQRITDFGPSRVSAVVVEPITGNGGIVLSTGYLRSLADFCASNEIHLVSDEVTTGMGRVGALTRSEQIGVIPDLMTLGKGITSGYAPLSAVAVHERVYRSFLDVPSDGPFPLGSTSDGSPLAMAARAAVLEVLLEGEVLVNVAERSASLQQRLSALQARHEHIAEVSGHGLMYGPGMADPEGPRRTASRRTAFPRPSRPQRRPCAHCPGRRARHPAALAL